MSDDPSNVTDPVVALEISKAGVREQHLLDSWVRQTVTDLERVRGRDVMADRWERLLGLRRR